MGSRFSARAAARAAAIAALVGIAGCSDTKVEGVYPDRDPIAGDTTPYDYIERKDNSILGPGGLSFGGSDRERDSEGGATGVAVNGFLWRASLDTVSFMPVASADPFGGVIITDWHSMPEAPDERFKMNVYILGRSLRADGVRVSVFRQQRQADGGWADVRVADDAAARIEDAILTRARQLRFAALQQ